MNNIDKKKDERTLILLMIISIALYIVGLVLIPKESYHRGTHEEFSTLLEDEIEVDNLIYIKGVGEVFAYRDIYGFAFKMLFVSMFLCHRRTSFLPSFCLYYIIMLSLCQPIFQYFFK